MITRHAVLCAGGSLRCKEGHTKVAVTLREDDYGEKTWVDISCSTCYRTLFYNGA